MSNPFHKASLIKHLLSILVLVTFSLSFAPLGFAQGAFDFTDDDGGDDGGFDFVDTPPAPLNLNEVFVMPTSGKPVVLVFFEPVDGTPQRTLDNLTEAAIDQIKRFDEYKKDNPGVEFDAVKAIPVLERLGRMSADERFMCLDDADCVAGMGREIGVAYIVVGSIRTENVQSPPVELHLFEVATATKKNSHFFSTEARTRKQQQDMGGAILRLFNIKLPDFEPTPVADVESAPLPLGQMIGGIVVGVVGLAAVGTGIYFGLEAKKYDQKVKDAIRDNEDGEYGSVDNQLTAKANHDKAKDYAMIANILYATGAVAAVVSVILFLVRSDKDDDFFAQHKLYIAPSADQNGGGGVVAGFSF